MERLLIVTCMLDLDTLVWTHFNVVGAANWTKPVRPSWSKNSFFRQLQEKRQGKCYLDKEVLFYATLERYRSTFEMEKSESRRVNGRGKDRPIEASQQCRGGGGGL